MYASSNLILELLRFSPLFKFKNRVLKKKKKTDFSDRANEEKLGWLNF